MPVECLKAKSTEGNGFKTTMTGTAKPSHGGVGVIPETLPDSNLPQSGPVGFPKSAKGKRTKAKHGSDNSAVASDFAWRLATCELNKMAAGVGNCSGHEANLRCSGIPRNGKN